MSYLSNKPVVYFVFCQDAGPSSTRFGGFVRRLVKTGAMPDADYRCVAMQQMVFAIDRQSQAHIYCHSGQGLFNDADYVYFKSWESMPEQAAMIASYLDAKGIPYDDAAVSRMGVCKSSQTWRLWANSLPVIPTVVAYKLPSRELIKQALGAGPYIIKPVDGQKGQDVEKISSYKALQMRIGQDSSGWLIQPYIANDGDERVIIYGDVRGAIRRKGAKGSVTNNTSQGASSEFIEAADIPAETSNLARKAARACELAIAGVDVIKDGAGNLMVMEVNQGSQVVTGHFTDKKVPAFADYMQQAISQRYVRQKRNNKLETIGRYIHVNLPELGAKQIFAKVDTGAYQSAIHATGIREVTTPDGKMLEFKILAGHSKADRAEFPEVCRVKEYSKTVVSNSFGIPQNRYMIKTRMSINGRMMKTGITLTDRKDMIAPLLLGRHFLRGRYIVNVELSRIGWEKTL